MGTLATVLALPPTGNEAFAQTSAASPFQPSLSNPRYAERFKAVDQSPLATAEKIVPPSGAGESGYDSTGALRKKKKVKSKPGEARPVPPPPPRSPGPPQQADGHTLAQQVKEREAYADAYRPPDALPRRPPRPEQDPYEPLGIRAGTFLLKPAVEVTRGYDTNPSHSSTGSSSAYTLVEPSLSVRSQWSRHEYGFDLRGSYSECDKDSL
jgi:hypothetical protein